MFSIRFWVALSVILTISGGAYYWYQNREEPFVPYEDFGEWLSEEPRSEADIENYVENLQEAYTNDTYGGDTPQETLRLLHDALAEGDIELASKYFLVEKQEKIYTSLQTAQKNNVISLIVEAIEMGGEGSYFTETSYEFKTKDLKGEGAGFLFTFIKNPYSGVWKIEDL